MKDWIKRTLSEKDGSPSSKRQILMGSVLLTGIVALFSFILRIEVPNTAVTLLQTLLGVSGVSYSVTRALGEKSSNGANE